MLPQRQQDLSSTGDHFELVHSKMTRRIAIWTPDLERQWHYAEASQARALLTTFSGQTNVFTSPNEFFGRRLVRHLARLNALYVDIDRRDGGNPVESLERALSVLAQAQVPPPTATVYSGRGVHLYWLIDPTPAEALPRWQACQHRLQKLLNSDPHATDCTRVLRVVGSTNPKADAARRTVLGEHMTPGRYDFDWLADQVLPHTRAEIRDIRAARSKRTASAGEREHQRGQSKGSIYNWWALVYRDLMRIAEYHWFGGIPEGHRDTFLFLMAVALSWFTHSEALRDEVAACARQFTPSMTEAEALSCTSTVLGRAVDAAGGRRLVFQGTERDPRYWFRRETLYQRLAPMIPPDLLPDLRAVIPGELRLQRKAAHDRTRDRVKEGRYLKHRCPSQTREQAMHLVIHGAKISDVASRFDVTERTIRNWLKASGKIARLK